MLRVYTKGEREQDREWEGLRVRGRSENKRSDNHFIAHT